MEKFCIKCGKKIEDGKACTCDAKKEIDILKQIQTTIRNSVNLFLEITKSLIKAPVDTIKKYGTKKNFKFGMIVMFISAIIFGLFFYFLLKENHYELRYFLLNRDIPFMKTLLLGTLFVIVGFFVTITMLYVLSTVFKAKIDFKTTTSMVGVCSIIITVALLISTVVVFLSIKFAFLILFVAMLFYLVYLCQGIMEITKIDKNKLAYVFVPTILVTLFVVVYIVPNLLF